MIARAGHALSHRALSKRHDRNAFACGSAELERYLKRQARQGAEKRVAAPFVVVEPPGSTVLGYYTRAVGLGHPRRRAAACEALGVPPPQPAVLESVAAFLRRVANPPPSRTR